MDARTLAPLLGRPQDDPELIDRLRGWGVDIEMEVFPITGRDRRYIERPDQGFALLFEGRSAPLRFTTVFLYDQGHEDCDRFVGTLPFDLDFEEPAEAVVARLGAPSWSSAHSREGHLVGVRWDAIADYRVHLSLRATPNTPKLITLMAAL